MRIVNMKKNNSTKSGFTLLGVIISAFFAIVVIVALASMISQIFGMSRLSKNRFIAVGLAKEGIELVRNMSNSNWLYYPQVAGGPAVSTMLWRGDGTGGNCAGTGACQRPRDICNGGPYTIDATQLDLALASLVNGGKLYVDSAAFTSGVYTHVSSGNTQSIYSRTISVGLEPLSAGEQEADYMDVNNSNCGFPVVFPVDPVNKKPRGVRVTSTVTWKEPGTNPDKEVVLSAVLYDWVTTRP